MSRPFDAIVFDAFGTLVQIGRPLRPYARLRQVIEDRGVKTDKFAVQAMTTRHSLARLAAAAGCPLPLDVLAPFERAVTEEVASVVAFPDAPAALVRALECADRVVVGSNLAPPYGAPVVTWLSQWGEVEPLAPSAKARLLTAFSFDLGQLKPNAGFYQEVGQRLAQLSGKPVGALKVAMVGDKQAEDYTGPRAAGWQAHRLDRAAGQVLLDAPWWP